MNPAREIPNAQIPVIPLRNAMLFPGQTIPIVVGRLKSVSALERAQKKNDWVLIMTQRSDLKGKDPTPEDLPKVTTLSKVESMKGDTKNGYQLLVTGVTRFLVSEYKEEDGFIQASGYPLEDVFDLEESTTRVLVKSMKDMSKEILNLVPANTDKLGMLIDAIEDPVFLTHLVSQHLDLPLSKKQEILEMISLKNRYLLLLDLMVKQKEELKLQVELNQKLSQKMGKQQREAYLREQIKAMQDELGENKAGSSKGDYRKRIEEAQMPEEVKKIALEQVDRLEAMGPTSPEYQVTQNYLDLLCSMPWSISSSEEIDLTKARRRLEEDHYGLEKIKKRIIQHLAVMKLKKDKKGSILLFIGPPGVGKTSLGKSIAAALGRRFVRVSLGGVRDDAEIRGHRRTYIGAMAGKIVEGIKRAGENNPVFMLDEIDKLSHSYHGDPASALLEVLDPEQNATFTDHYLDVAFDLSKVFFIATANTLETIPPPLLDRMETIHLSGYTTPEKLHIAKRHLLPKQWEEHGITSGQLEITDGALLKIITHYTREAGVRDLQRNIAECVRASSEKVLNRITPLPIQIGPEELQDVLGSEKFFHEVAQLDAPPGVVTGLAWTPMGGEILFTEAGSMEGSGKLTLTGQLGEVMKESAQIALSLVRSKLGPLAQIPFDKQDLHVHVPAGATPKDGPSAGITLLTAIASLVLKKKVDPRLAMTGEITLRGAVMPVGGVKEKVIAADRAGIERIILSKRNEHDLKEIPEDIKSRLRFEFVDKVEEVLHIALGIDLTNSPTHYCTDRGRPPLAA